MQLESCGQPAIVTKDLCVVIQGRSGARSIKNLFLQTKCSTDANRLTGLYEMLLRRANDFCEPLSLNLKTYHMEILQMTTTLHCTNILNNLLRACICIN